MIPPIAVHFAGYCLWWWLVISTALLFSKSKSVPAFGLLYLTFYASQAFVAYSPIRAIVGLHGTYANGIAQFLVVWACFGHGCKDFKKYLTWLYVAVCLQAGFQYAFPSVDFLTPSGIWYERSYAPLGNPVFLGAALAMAGVFILPGKSWPYWALGVLAILLTKSRGAVLALGVGLGFVYWRPFFRARLGKFAVLAFILVGGIGLFSLSKMGSDRARLEVWRTCYAAQIYRPWGWGLENTYYAIQKHRDEAFDKVYSKKITQDQCHNAILESVVSGGVMGPLVTAICLFWLLAISSPGRPRGVILAYLAVAMFNPIPFSAQCLAAAILGYRNNRGLRVPIPPVALATLSLFAALICLRCYRLSQNPDYPVSYRIEAARIIGLVDPAKQ